MESLINKLQKRRGQLSSLEKQVFDYVLRNPEKIQEMTVEQLANQLFISTATISRTAKRLGYKGFQELKYAITQYSKEVNQGLIVTDLQKSQSIIESIEKQISKTLKGIQSQDLDRIVEHLLQAESIEIFGVGGSLPNCIDMARKLTFLGKKANARIDWDEQQAISNNLTTNDLAVIISNSGETIHIIDYAMNLKKCDVPIVAIIGTTESHLEQIADYTLLGVVEMFYFQEIDLSSRVSLTLITDILLIQLAEKFNLEL